MLGLKGVGSRMVLSPFDPSTVAGLTLWLKSKTGVLNGALTPALPGEGVRTWQDQSVNGHDLSQGTVGNRPIYNTKYIQFDGVDDLLLRTIGNIQYNGGQTFIVWQVDDVASGIADLFAGGDADGQVFRQNTLIGGSDFFLKEDGEYILLEGGDILLTEIDSGGAAVTMRMNAGAFNSDVTYTYDIRYLSSLGYLGASGNHRRNRVSLITGNVGTNTALGLALGASRTAGRPFKGRIYEVLVYQTALTGADLANVEHYLKTKFTI